MPGIARGFRVFGAPNAHPPPFLGVCKSLVAKTSRWLQFLGQRLSRRLFEHLAYLRFYLWDFDDYLPFIQITAAIYGMGRQGADAKPIPCAQTPALGSHTTVSRSFRHCSSMQTVNLKTLRRSISPECAGGGPCPVKLLERSNHGV